MGWPTHVPALLGPMAAALLVTSRAGRAAVVDLLRRMVSAKVAPRWWAMALSPFVLLVAAGAAAVGWISADLTGLAVFPGVSTGWGMAAVVAIVLVVNGFGEETGWRGFAQPVLQRRHGPWAATPLVASIWAVWHLPTFLVLSSFRSFSPVMLVGWTIGLVSGAVVLAFLYNRSNGSILLPALWHGGFNLLSATAVGAGLLGAASTALVILAAAALVIVELVRARSGHPSVLLPHTGAGPAGRHTSPEATPSRTTSACSPTPGWASHHWCSHSAIAMPNMVELLGGKGANGRGDAAGASCPGGLRRQHGGRPREAGPRATRFEAAGAGRRGAHCTGGPARP